MLVLGIESSCDETSAAVVEDGVYIRALCTWTQTDVHAKYKGVVPELASRTHIERIFPLADECLQKAGVQVSQLDGVAATNRPGLSGSLIVGLSFAKAFAYAAGLPFVSVNHLHAHAYSIQLTTPMSYPYLVLLVSGGHTLIGIYHNIQTLELLGCTVDDACGEAYDKIAAFLDAGFPGGPCIDMLAQKGNKHAYSFPVSRLNHANARYDFSFSGLKTAVVHQRKRFWNPRYPESRENIAAAFQDVIIRMIVTRVENAFCDTGIPRLAACGGVAANSALRQRLQEIAKDRIVAMPTVELCTDNAAMVAGLGGRLFHAGETSSWDTGISAVLPLK